MRAGLLRHRIEIEDVLEDGRDEYGELQQEWTGRKRWGSVDPLDGAERFQAQQVHADVTHLIRVRKDADLNVMPSQRIRFGDRVFHILSVLNPDERNVELRILARESLNPAAMAAAAGTSDSSSGSSGGLDP